MTWLSKFLRKLFSIREQQEADVVKPFLDHLEDLRVTLFKMAFSLAIGMVIALYFNQVLMDLVTRPLTVHGLKLVTGGLPDGFMITLKLAFYAGIVLSFPMLLYFAAEFVLPALTRKEKRMLLPGILVGFLLFGVGVVISYQYVLPRTIGWFVDYNRRHGFDVLPLAAQYFALVTHLTLACGLLCELPIVIITLALLGIVSYRLLANTRAYAIILIGILIAILSPSPDPVTFLTLSLPVMAIYEMCIWIVWLIERRKS